MKLGASVRGLERRALFLTAAALSVAIPSPTWAQDAAGDAQSPADDDQSSAGDVIVVTALRTEQTLQSVPISAAVISGKEVAARNLTDLRDIAAIIPNFSVRDAGAAIQYNIRGSTTLSTSTFLENAVSTYVNDVYMASPTANDAVMFDVSRVEVLRGPQGVLFGRNSTGGLVNFITNRPGSDFGGYVRAQYGSYDRTELAAAIDVPVGESVAMRLATRIIDRDDWQKNLGAVGGAFGGISSVNARVTLQAELGEKFTATLIGSINRNRNNNYANGSWGGAAWPRQPFDFAAPRTRVNCSTSVSDILSRAPQCLFYNPNRRGIFPNDGPDTRTFARVEVAEIPRRFDQHNGTLDLKYDLSDRATLRSITAYNWSKFQNFDEFDGTEFLDFYSDVRNKARQVTQEITLTGELSDRLTYVLGGFYLDARARGLPPTIGIDMRQGYRDTESLAGFANVRYEFSPSVAVFAGGRVTDEKKAILSTNSTSGNSFEAQTKSNFFTYRIGLEVTPLENLMFFASRSTGRKAAEFTNADPDTNGGQGSADLFNPEQVLAHELGIKGSTLDGIFSGSLVFFHQRTRNFQFGFPTLLNAEGSAFTSLNSSIEKFTARGFEAEMTVRPNSWIRFFGSVGYNATRIVDSATRTQTWAQIIYPVDGNEMPGTPKLKASGGATVTVPSSVGSFELDVNYAWQDDLFWDISNNPFAVEEAYGIGNARVTWREPNRRLSATLAVDNVFNQIDHAALRFWADRTPFIVAQWGNDPGRVWRFEVGYEF